MRDDPALIGLVKRARDGDQEAWDRIVERYAPLVWSTCARYRLSGADADDVGATVWLRLVERVGSLRDPAALAGWLATTARNECVQVLRSKQRHVQTDGELLPEETQEAADDWLLKQERHIALRAAFAGLSERCRALLSLLFADPAVPYADISGRLAIPVGGIGPTRQRCLAALRAHPLMIALGEGPTDEPGT
jgi:RNA polymerase sigma factor (sigma-70 family)